MQYLTIWSSFWNKLAGRNPGEEIQAIMSSYWNSSEVPSLCSTSRVIIFQYKYLYTCIYAFVIMKKLHARSFYLIVMRYYANSASVSFYHVFSHIVYVNYVIFFSLIRRDFSYCFSLTTRTFIKLINNQH